MYLDYSVPYSAHHLLYVSISKHFSSVCVCVRCVCMRAYMCVCMRAYVRVCMHACVIADISIVDQDLMHETDGIQKLCILLCEYFQLLQTCSIGSSTTVMKCFY